MLCIVYNLILLIQFIEYGIRQVLEEVAFYYDTELNSADLAILREELTTAYLIASMEICPYQRCDDNLSLISMMLHEVIFNRHYIEWYFILVILLQQYTSLQDCGAVVSQVAAIANYIWNGFITLRNFSNLGYSTSL